MEQVQARLEGESLHVCINPLCFAGVSCRPCPSMLCCLALQKIVDVRENLNKQTRYLTLTTGYSMFEQELLIATSSIILCMQDSTVAQRDSASAAMISGLRLLRTI